jgi:hypothetical protein
MAEQDLSAEIDAMKAQIALMQRQIVEAETKSEAAFVRAEQAATHVANLMQRINSLSIVDPRVR